MPLSLSCSSGYSPWANGDPHRSGFKFDCNIFRITCDVFSIAIICSESAELLSSHGFVFSYKTFGTIHVFPVFTRIITHFIFHIPSISIHGLLYFSFSFCFLFRDMAVRGYCHGYQNAGFLFICFVFGDYFWLIFCNSSICDYLSIL